MVPSVIEKRHVLQAIDHINQNGVPPSRGSRRFCLVHDTAHYPPKYLVSLAHRFATGRLLESEEFSGGPETNAFLTELGFRIQGCNCGGASPLGPQIPPVPRGHSERCGTCKTRVRQLLEKIYGDCAENVTFEWKTRPEHYQQTSIYQPLLGIYRDLCRYRGHTDFIKTQRLPPCDFLVPNPGFILEFDESQHFTRPRKISLSLYPPGVPIGFPIDRWISLCEQHNEEDHDPPYRDEQRAWYDSLRDLLPPLQGLHPTLRIYASDYAWCSLDPELPGDVARFEEMVGDNLPAPEQKKHGSLRNGRAERAGTERMKFYRVALVFPPVWDSSSAGLPPAKPFSRRAEVPTSREFHNESPQLVVFPEAYVHTTEKPRLSQLADLARALGTHLIVGAQESVHGRENGAQILLHFSPDGRSQKIYTKHSTAGAIAFELPGWSPERNLPVVDINGIRVGFTICHDSYLGLLQRYIAKRGAQLWVNPSFDNVVEEKWASIHRLRAVENGFTALCTLHANQKKRRHTHPFGFGPDGRELLARKPGEVTAPRPLSECRDPGIYLVDAPLGTPEARQDPGILPTSQKWPSTRVSGTPSEIRVSPREGSPGIQLRDSWAPITPSTPLTLGKIRIMFGLVHGAELLEIGSFFTLTKSAEEENCSPVFWNIWDQLPAESDQLVSIMLGRSLEFCAPVILSDRRRIYEVTEIANNEKNLRRVKVETAETTLDLRRAWGLKSAFKMVRGHLTGAHARQLALERYASLLD